MLTYCASATVYKLNVPWSVCACECVPRPVVFLPGGRAADPGRGFVNVRNVHFMVHIRGMIFTRVNLKSSAIVSIQVETSGVMMSGHGSCAHVLMPHGGSQFLPGCIQS